MTVSILDLVSDFDDSRDRESETAYFRTSVPWVAPFAYLHIVFKPASHELLCDLYEKLGLPESVKKFFSIQNGANLFSGALNLYGIHRPGQLLNRDDPLAALPFDIELENRAWPPTTPEHFLGIGGYGFDGSTICIDRRDSRVHLFKRGEEMLLPEASVSWDTLDIWIESEIARLSFLFDSRGRRLVEEGQTIPPGSHCS